MVLQDTWLFHGTIFENIAYGKEGVTREQVEEVCKAAEIHNYIMSLPDGYDTLLSDNATNISKGQKQLLTIARAMLLSSHMLILDEATSNVDTRTERRIQSAMLRLMRDEDGPRTCFVIAHRLSTIRNADFILVMQNGEIVEQGRHDELISAAANTQALPQPVRDLVNVYAILLIILSIIFANSSGTRGFPCLSRLAAPDNCRR